LSAKKELEKWKRKGSSFFNDIKKNEEIHGVRDLLVKLASVGLV